MSFQCVVYDKKTTISHSRSVCVVYDIKKNPHALFFFSYILEAERRDPHVMEKVQPKFLFSFILPTPYFYSSSIPPSTLQFLLLFVLSFFLSPFDQIHWSVQRSTAKDCQLSFDYVVSAVISALSLHFKLFSITLIRPFPFHN